MSPARDRPVTPPARRPRRAAALTRRRSSLLDAWATPRRRPTALPDVPDEATALLAEAEQRLRAVRECLHDARSLVAGVRAASSMTRHPAFGDDPARRAAVEQAVDRELARLERMLQLPDRAPAPGAVALDDVIGFLVGTHRQRGLAVSWTATGTGPVTVDADALAVIVGNLLDNALAHAAGAPCRVSAHLGDQLTVTVADDGPGLGDTGAVFSPGVHRTGSPGEGLGLGIARAMARAHGGELVAESSRAGATFTLTLPLGAVHLLPTTLSVDPARLRLVG
ncbi:hypothetical protein GB931_02420 [Modestobacter sp. I12A-02628]|uniref:histidine kinase n=2 Tax=Goekera deserti TaxID=2497753 RepID=A0A7K3WD95_9ACTN|nr:HAMP domain-containing sensor histidine kinase [Goekera deserti]MPQ96793.1 hypothetical protein [Goekera deserti]NDI46893.1 hypothetical protein [Goekera deserti]NEL54461.1 HAMP domain-containing histidine kinase [Goekera deserti]